MGPNLWPTRPPRPSGRGSFAFSFFCESQAIHSASLTSLAEPSVLHGEQMTGYNSKANTHTHTHTDIRLVESAKRETGCPSHTAKRPVWSWGYAEREPSGIHRSSVKTLVVQARCVFFLFGGLRDSNPWFAGFENPPDLGFRPDVFLFVLGGLGTLNPWIWRRVNGRSPRGKRR